MTGCGCGRHMFGSFHCGKIPEGAFRGKWKLWLAEHARLPCDDCRRKPPELAPLVATYHLCSVCSSKIEPAYWCAEHKDAPVVAKPAPLATDQAALFAIISAARREISRRFEGILDEGAMTGMAVRISQDAATALDDLAAKREQTDPTGRTKR